MGVPGPLKTEIFSDSPSARAYGFMRKPDGEKPDGDSLSAAKA